MSAITGIIALSLQYSVYGEFVIAIIDGINYKNYIATAYPAVS